MPMSGNSSSSIIGAVLNGEDEEGRMRNKYSKPTAFPFNAGGRCSISVVVLSVVGFFVMLHLYTLVHRKVEVGGMIQSHVSRDPEFRQLFEEADEENLQIPLSKGKRSSRAHRRIPKEAVPIIEEFLDENSKIKNVFFPDQKNAINPLKGGGNDSFYYYPGRVWLDTDGNPIHAHGGGVLYDSRLGKYYWYGEYKDGRTYHAHKKGAARVDIIGVGCYSSNDLWTWKNEGIVLAGEETDETHDLYKLNVLERPKVIYNEKTKKYVMWMHIDDTNYTKASVGIATSDNPTGPFVYLHSKQPHGYESRDMTLFKDDDGTAYLIYSSEHNNVLHVGPLTADYLDVKPEMSRVFVGQRREAPALFKHEGTYYMITSGCTGWSPNEALTHAAESILGPWETIGNPFVGGNKVYRLTTFLAQSTFVIPMPEMYGSFIFMADRWNPADLKNSRYVWLPLSVAGPVDRPLDYSFGFPLWSRVSIYWHRKWKLPHRSSKSK